MSCGDWGLRPVVVRIESLGEDPASRFNGQFRGNNTRVRCPAAVEKSLLSFRVKFSLAMIGFLFCQPANSIAQGRGGKPPVPKSSASDQQPTARVHVELLTGNEGVGLKAQEWIPIFEKLGVDFQVRRSVLEDKPEVTERTLGNKLREVRVVGILDKRGAIQFPEKSFTTADVAPLKEWLEGLQVYGAQGSPEGQPTWGLTKTQFEPFFGALSREMTVSLAERSLDKALAEFLVQQKYPLKFSVQATERLAQKDCPAEVANMVTGFSEGTTLAAILNSFDLGFRPQRTPAGGLEILIVSLAEGGQVWPVGWPPPNRPVDIAPQLFQSVEIELEAEPLEAVLEAVGDLVKLPVLVDRHGLKQQKIDLAEFKVSHPKKKVPWSLALKRLTFQAKARWEIRVDETGHPFLWVYPEPSLVPSNSMTPKKKSGVSVGK